MEQQNAELFIQTKGKYFPADKIYTIREMLEKADDNKFNILNITPFKSTTTVVLFALFLGGLGIDRFITGSTGIGILKIVAGVIYFITYMAATANNDLAALFIIPVAIWIWFVVEIFTASKRTKNFNFQTFMGVIS